MVRVETPGRRKQSALSIGVEPQKKRDLSPSERAIKVLKQTGTVKSLVRDASRKARLPGRRESKSGNIYWETRKNRSDALGKNI